MLRLISSSVLSVAIHNMSMGVMKARLLAFNVDNCTLILELGVF